MLKMMSDFALLSAVVQAAMAAALFPAGSGFAMLPLTLIPCVVLN